MSMQIYNLLDAIVAMNKHTQQKNLLVHVQLFTLKLYTMCVYIIFL